MTRGIGYLLLAALPLACGCVPPERERGDVVRPVMVPPRKEPDVDVKRLVGMKAGEAVRLVEGWGLRCQVLGQPTRPRPLRARNSRGPDPHEFAVVLLSVRDDRVMDATLTYELSAGQ